MCMFHVLIVEAILISDGKMHDSLTLIAVIQIEPEILSFIYPGEFTEVGLPRITGVDTS